MRHRMITALGLIIIMTVSTGCGNRQIEEKQRISDTVDTEENQEPEASEKNPELKDTSDTEEKQELKTPQTKQEMDEAFGTVDKQGKWNPPEGSHVDPQTGNIINKDGVVVGTTQRPRPASQASPGSVG